MFPVTVLISLVRHISFTSVTRRKPYIRVKELNYENKNLFGPVQKTKKKLKESVVTYEKEQNDSSEKYWLLQGTNKKILTKNSIRVTNNIKPNHSKESRAQGSEIPFSDKHLASLIRFPLIFSENDQELELEKPYNCSYPSVSKILEVAMPEAAREALIKWKLQKLAELGEEGFNKLQQDNLRKGKLMHEALQIYLTSGTLPQEDSEVLPLWKSVQCALELLKPEPELIETPVQHPILKYKGVIDCVSRIGTDLSIIEWKKSDKPKTQIGETFDAPVQLCAYAGALSADPQYKLTIKKGFVIIAYTNGQPASIHTLNEIDLRKYWQIWLQKVQEFWIRTRDGTIPEAI